MIVAERSDAIDASQSPCAPVRGGFVCRRGLFERLSRAGQVTEVSGVAGSGKTYLLRSWIAEYDLADSAAWVPVQAEEQDPQRFWIAVLDALRDTIAGSKLIRPLTGAPDLSGWAVVERLLEDLEPLEDSLWLVIDDVHELRSGEALAQLELLVMRAPPDLRFVLASRRKVRLGLHRLRLEGKLTEIYGADLQFSVDEARALLSAAGTQLPEPTLAALVKRTEGWAAGLQLAALALAGHPDPERFAAEFSGSQRTVAEYLLAEVLDHQSEQVRRLLLHTSVCERVSGELADRLTGGSGGERILQDLEDAGAFVVSLDGRRSWFRYHPLFADLLQLELRRGEPAGLAAPLGAAARWYAEHGYPVEGVRHAQAAREWDLAARLLSDHFLSLTLDGRGATIHELLARFPAEVVGADPKLAVLMASDEVLRGSLLAAERRLLRAQREITAVPAERRGRFELNLAIMRLSLAQRRGDLPAVFEVAQRLLGPAEAADASPSIDADTRAQTLVTLGTAELWALQAADAEQHLQQASAMARHIGRPWLEVDALTHWGWAASFRSFALADRLFTQAIELAEEHGWAGEPVAALAYAGRAFIRIWQMQLEDAEARIDQAARALRSDADPLAAGVLHQARGMLELARGDDASALAAFRVAEGLAGLLAAAHPRSTPMRGHMLQALVRLGDTGLAEHALAALQDSDHHELRNAMAALRLVQGDPRAATAALAPILDGSVPVANVGWASEAFLLQAIADDALGDQAAATGALEHALALVEPDGALFAFVLHPVPELLQRHAARGTSHSALVAEILSLLAEPEGYRGHRSFHQRGRPGEAPSRLIEPLSGSESRVVRFLPTNLSAPEISRQLSVSVHTVRTHMRHVYQKLGAHSRSEAVERARAMGLLAPVSRRV